MATKREKTDLVSLRNQLRGIWATLNAVQPSRKDAELIAHVLNDLPAIGRKLAEIGGEQ